MREITSHKCGKAIDQMITIKVLDEPGQGNACHRYEINVNMSEEEKTIENDPLLTHQIFFQNGPVQEFGVNGITQEALLAICIDRLECFQAGPFACRENALALTKMQEAMHWLHHRTLERVNRGVEGTNQK